MAADIEIKNLMASTWTRASLVRRAFKAGPRRKKDRAFDDIEHVVLAAYESFLDLRSEMRSAGLPMEDAKAALILLPKATDGYNNAAGRLLPVPDTLRHIPNFLGFAEQCIGKEGMTPIGLAFWQKDSDARAKAAVTAWGQAWRIDARSARAAECARADIEEFGGFEAFDDAPECGWAFVFEEV